MRVCYIVGVLLVSCYYCSAQLPGPGQTTSCPFGDCFKNLGLLNDSDSCPCSTACCQNDESEFCDQFDPKESVMSKQVPCRIKRRKRDAPLNREKRQIVTGTSGPIIKKFWWRCDFPCMACCRTCRRTIPFIEPITAENSILFPVYCPTSGGFQLIDQIQCLQNKCKKKCKVEYTLYSYLVTDTAPDPTTGHCDKQFISVWFFTLDVATHCVCPKEGKKC